MKINDPNIKAEDILADSMISDHLIKGDLQSEEMSFKEFKLALDIQQLTKSSKNELSSDHRLILDQRIMTSIKKKKKKKILSWTSSVAVLFLLIGLTIIINSLNQSDLLRYAKTESSSIESEYTKLVLPDKEEIQIISKESKIEYSANGRTINIDEQRIPDNPAPAVEGVYNTLIVPYGKRSQLKLPDNTIVWLNSGSKLIYPAKFGAEKREVFLEGEAMFNVKRDENQPFFVLTNNLEIKVLGTIFNICAYTDDTTINTVLESGSVELKYKSAIFDIQGKKELIPGMLAVYNTNEKSIVETMVNTKDFTSWKDGFVVLEKNTLGSIVKKLSRYYNVKIEFEDPELETETFSGYMDLRDSATNVLELISEIIDIEIVRDESIIMIKKAQNHS